MRWRGSALNFSGSDLPVALSAAVGLGFVLNQGPHLQKYVISLLTSDQASIYSAVFGKTIVEYPSLAEWTFGYFDLSYLAIAFFVVLYSARSRLTRGFFVNLAASSFLAISATDIVREILLGGVSLARLTEHIVSNLVGAPLLASIVVLTLAGSRWTRKVLAKHAYLRSSAAILFPVTVGLLSSCAMYYGSLLFFNPAQASFEARAKFPVRGFTIPPKSKSEAAPFKFFSEEVRTKAEISWTGFSEALTMKWRRESSVSGYRVDVFGIDGCFMSQRVAELLPEGTALHSFDDVKTLEFRMSDGMSEFALLPSTSAGINARFDEEGPSMYWLSGGSEEGTVNLSLFSDANSKLTLWSHSEPLLLYFSGHLLSPNRESTKSIEARLIVDEVEHVFEFNPRAAYLAEDAIGCSLMQVVSGGGNGYVHQDSELQVGLVIAINPPGVGRDLFDRRVDSAQISGMGGWLTVKSASEKEAQRIVGSGILYGFAAYNGLEELAIDGDRIQVARDDSLQATDGSIRVSMGSSDTLLVSGDARAIYLDGARANKTRWERIDWPGRAVLFAFFPTLGLFLGRILLRLLRDNARLFSGVSFVRKN